MAVDSFAPAPCWPYRAAASRPGCWPRLAYRSCFARGPIAQDSYRLPERPSHCFDGSSAACDQEHNVASVSHCSLKSAISVAMTCPPQIQALPRFHRCQLVGREDTSQCRLYKLETLLPYCLLLACFAGTLRFCYVR